MKYLVCRKDALKPDGRMRTSEYFPMEVRAPHGETDSPESIVRMALDRINRGYVGMHEYIVVPLKDARIVSFQPRQSYDVEVRFYED